MSHDGPLLGRHIRHTELSELPRRLCRVAAVRVRAFSFWLAVSLPWLLLGVAISGQVTSYPELFAGLFAATVVCAVLGRNHAT